MADTCRGLDASAPKEVREQVKQYVRSGKKKRRNGHLDGGKGDSAYCLLELLDGDRCSIERGNCRYQADGTLEPNHDPDNPIG